VGRAMRKCPKCGKNLGIDFLSTFPKHMNRDGDYVVICVSYNSTRNCYEKSYCGYWELYENNILIDKEK
jgi:predicted nucleic-acid-binding Zn-ribbon protein